MLASKGDRPHGYVYAMARNPPNKRVLFGTSGNINGLKLEETDGQVKIIDTPVFGHFAGLRLSEGDTLCAINGIRITSIKIATTALKVVSGPLIPILTYNPLLRLSSTIRDSLDLMANAGEAVSVEGEFEFHEKVRHLMSGRGRYPLFPASGAKLSS